MLRTRFSPMTARPIRPMSQVLMFDCDLRFPVLAEESGDYFESNTMATEFCEIIVTREPLKIPPHRFRPEAGAVVDFFGVVRDEEAGGKIAALDYEAHVGMAEHQLRKIAEEARAKFGFHALTLHHRIGSVPVAEPSLFVRVTARHRGPA